MDIVFRSAYGDRDRLVFDTTGESMTKQSEKDRCDINRIVKGYQRNGVISHANGSQPSYGDATGVDFQEAMNLVVNAENSFMALPANVRSRFANDPAKFLEFTSNEDNLEEMYDLGLAARPVVEDEASTGADVPSDPVDANQA